MEMAHNGGKCCAQQAGPLVYPQAAAAEWSWGKGWRSNGQQW